jgi:hypothetical protein
MRASSAIALLGALVTLAAVSGAVANDPLTTGLNRDAVADADADVAPCGTHADAAAHVAVADATIISPDAEHDASHAAAAEHVAAVSEKFAEAVWWGPFHFHFPGTFTGSRRANTTRTLFVSARLSDPPPPHLLRLRRLLGSATSSRVYALSPLRRKGLGSSRLSPLQAGFHRK